jgi:hypothetical protein
LNEKDRRRYAAIEAAKLGWGGISYISGLLGCDYYTIRSGRSELEDEAAINQPGIRSKGGGRKSSLETVEGLDEAFLEVIAEHTAGSPIYPLRKSVYKCYGHCIFKLSCEILLNRGTVRGARKMKDWAS